MATDTLKSYYDRFPDAVKQSSYGKDVSKQLNDRNIGVPGAIAANFIADDLQGKKLALSQFKGKYILLDFWGSWCLPCRKSHPHLKTLYGKYKQQGFEIIGVAQEYNDDKNAWRKAVTEDQVDWLHVMTTHNPEADIINKYNIVYFPTKILIDKEGVIIGRYGEKDLTELDAKLESIFKR
jgi:thiol-disulfide isomerase/thioredoxin